MTVYVKCVVRFNVHKTLESKSKQNQENIGDISSKNQKQATFRSILLNWNLILIWLICFFFLNLTYYDVQWHVHDPSMRIEKKYEPILLRLDPKRQRHNRPCSDPVENGCCSSYFLGPRQTMPHCKEKKRRRYDMNEA